MYVDVNLSGLMSGYMAAAGTITIKAGEHVDRGDIRFRCAAGGDDCVVKVAVDDGTITAMYRSTGGVVTAVDVPGPMPRYGNVDLSGLKSGFDAVVGRLQIAAGAHVDHGDIRFRCAAGGEDCTVMVMVAGDGTITAGALSTGGTVTATDATVDVDLKDVTVGFWADAIMMLEIDPGESEDHGDIRFSCADGRYDCTVMVMVANDGTITAMSIGGTVTAEDAGDPNTSRDQALDDAIGMPYFFDSTSLGAEGKPSGSSYTEMPNAPVAAIEDWTSSVHEYATGPADMFPFQKDTYVVYTKEDVSYLTDMPYLDVYGGATIDGISSVNPMSGVIMFDNATPSLALPGLISVDGNVPTGSSTITVQDAATVMGSFHDVSGAYGCTSGPCTITLNSFGELVTTGDLTFTPDDPAAAMVDVPNPDYMYFGYWQDESQYSATDPTVFQAGSVYGGAVPSDISVVQQLVGTAEYAGPATGLYVRRWTDTDGDVVRRRTGQFTALAELSANFDVTGVDDDYSISGTIANFMDGMKNKPIDPRWELALQETKFDSLTVIAPSNEFSGDTDGGAGTTGTWYGRFFGTAEKDSDLMTPQDQPTYPSGVAGEFSGHFTSGNVIGAFGAEYQPKPQEE